MITLLQYGGIAIYGSIIVSVCLMIIGGTIITLVNQHNDK